MKAFTIPAIFTAIDKLSKPVNKMEESVNSFASRTERKFRSIGQTTANIAKGSFAVGAAITAPLALAANEAIKFEDKMADVGKTTGLQGKKLEDFGQSILSLSKTTRTSIDDLVSIAEIGGQLGIAEKDLLAFTKASDQFNVAIGKDFSGGVEEAISAVGNIKSLFKETRDINIADSINKTGSVINELGAVGSATSANLADFTQRLGALPDAIKPSLTNTMALGAFLEEVGIKSEIGSGGLSNLLLVAGRNIDKFAAQMGMSSKAAKDLLAKDPTKFASQFAQSLNGLKADELASTLDGLKIGSQETIKVIGALGSGTKRLGELQAISNKAFEEGTSLTNEFNKKNSTTAAQLEKAQNNFKAFTIIIGTKLIPVVNKLMDVLIPAVSGIIDWAERNPKLTKTIVVIAAAVGGLALTLSIFFGVISLVTSAIAAWGLITKGVAAAQAFLNAVMMANPIGLFIINILLLIGLVTIIIKKWNDWGASIAAIFAVFMPGMMLIISLVQSFRRNWDMITESFSSGGMIAGIKAIGATILDAILMPLQQVLGIVAKVSGAKWASDAVSGIEALRKNIGVNTETDESGNKLPAKQAVNNDLARQESLRETITTNNQSLGINIKDDTGRAELDKKNFNYPVKLSSTMGF